jgi:16S rRNA (guanine1207-N2)-methyltransferase
MAERIISKQTYDQSREYTFLLRGQPVYVFSKAGFPHWDRLTSACQLLAENVTLKATDRVLLMGSGHGALAVCVARLIPQGCLRVADANLVCIRLTAKTLKANAILNALVYERFPFPTEKPGWFDNVMIELPKGRKLARRWLVEALSALKIGGSLYLSGPNQEGIQPAIRDASELFGNSLLLSYQKGNRVARFIKGETHPYADHIPGWASEPGIQPGTWHTFNSMIRGKEYLIQSLPGVFSYDAIDEGTRLLLENLLVPNGARVLDFGCGYGIIGLVAANLGASQVDLVDANIMAVASAQENILRNRLEGVSAFSGDGMAWAEDHSYDLIVSNPPFHAGKEVDFGVAEAFIEQAQRVLKNNGRLVLVANRFLRYDRQIQACFGNIEILTQTNHFHLLSSIKTPCL